MMMSKGQEGGSGEPLALKERKKRRKRDKCSMKRPPFLVPFRVLATAASDAPSAPSFVIVTSIEPEKKRRKMGVVTSSCLQQVRLHQERQSHLALKNQRKQQSLHH
jgi:hypothetical protein